MEKFWVVWRIGSDGFTMRHTTKHDAEVEAERLARGHHGQTFVVLEAMSACTKSDVVWQRLGIDEPPF